VNPQHNGDSRVVEKAEGKEGCLVLPAVQRVSVSLDRAELPCVDCFVGEPHICRLLTWGELVIEQDEWGGYVVVNA